MSERLRILHLEDSHADAELIEAALAAEGVACDIHHVTTRADYVQALEDGDFHLILSDHDLPGFDGFSALALARQRHAGMPFIMVTGVLGEEEAVEALKRGATDYVLKTRLGRLVPAVQRALREAHEQAARLQAQAQLEARARQQAAIAQLGLRALAGGSLAELMQAVAGQVAETLDVELCKVLELLPDGSQLRVVAGVGWAEGVVGSALVAATPDSQAGYTLTSEAPIIVADLRTETRFVGMALLRDEGVVSGMTVIIPGQPRVFGVLGVHSRQPRGFSREDANFLQAAANVLAEAIARQRAEDQLNDNARRLALLAEVSRAFAEAGADFQTVLDIITRKVAHVVGDACTVRLASSDREWLPVVADHHRNQRTLEFIGRIRRQSMPAGGISAAGRVLASGQPLVLTGMTPEQIRQNVAQAWWPYWETFGAHSLAAVPLQAQGNIIGVLLVTRDETPQPYTEEDLRLLQDLADRTALAVEHGRLYQAESQARRAAQRAAERTSRLQSVTAALSQALTPLQVAEVIVVQGTAALGGCAGQVLSLNQAGTGLEALHAVGYPAAYAARFSSVSLDDNQPSAHVARTGEALWINSHADFAAHYPHMAAARPAGQFEALAVAPLRFEGRILGTLVISFASQQTFGDEDRALLIALSDLCAQALERARLYSEAQALNARLEERVAARTAELQESHEQLRRLSARLEDVRELERARLAREVHDGIGQQLSGLKMDVAWLQTHLRRDQPRLVEKARAMARLLDETIAAVRQVTTDLRPGLLDDFGLLAAIEWQVRDFEVRHGIRSRFQSDISEVALAPESATTIFRVFQDALTNVARHAGATEVSVSLQSYPSYLLLRVSDNGRGMSLADLNNTQALGLVGMRERMRRLSGEFAIESDVGRGTTVLIKIPVQAAEAGSA
jgi:signal transduction histidine kinase/CheY-like chemotaxis protein